MTYTEKTQAFGQSFEERNQWIGAGIGLAAIFTYVAIIMVRAQDVPLVDVSWELPMLATVLAGGAVYAVVYFATRARFTAGTPRDSRDTEIDRFGEVTGKGLVSIAVIVAIVLLARDIDPFWVAHTLFFGSYLSSLVGTLARIGAYREGIPS